MGRARVENVSALEDGTRRVPKKKGTRAGAVGWSKGHSHIEMGAVDDSDRQDIDDDDNAPEMHRPPPPKQSCIEGVLFKICFLLTILMPVAVIAVAVRAVVNGATGEDTGPQRWSPDGDPRIPQIVSLVVIILLLLIFGVLFMKSGKSLCS